MRKFILLVSTFLLSVFTLACNQESPNIETGQTPSVRATTAAAVDPLPEATVSQPTEARQVVRRETATPAPDPTAPAVAGPVGVSTVSGSIPSVITSTGFRTVPIDYMIDGSGAPNQFGTVQAQPVGETLTVSAIGKVTVVPDRARIVVFPEEDYGPFGPQGFSKREEQDILQALVQAGIDEGDISIERSGRYEPSVVSVWVDVDTVEEQGKYVVDSVEGIIGRAGHYGVSFGLTDEICEETIALARREAIPVAEAAADDLSLALGLQRGRAMSALEFTSSHPFFADPSSSDPCASSSRYGIGPLLPFHREPEVEVSVGLQISYSLR